MSRPHPHYCRILVGDAHSVLEPTHKNCRSLQHNCMTACVCFTACTCRRIAVGQSGITEVNFKSTTDTSATILCHAEPRDMLKIAIHESVGHTACLPSMWPAKGWRLPSLTPDTTQPVTHYSVEIANNMAQHSLWSRCGLSLFELRPNNTWTTVTNSQLYISLCVPMETHWAC